MIPMKGRSQSHSVCHLQRWGKDMDLQVGGAVVQMVQPLLNLELGLSAECFVRFEESVMDRQHAIPHYLG